MADIIHLFLKNEEIKNNIWSPENDGTYAGIDVDNIDEGQLKLDTLILNRIEQFIKENWGINVLQLCDVDYLYNLHRTYNKICQLSENDYQNRVRIIKEYITSNWIINVDIHPISLNAINLGPIITDIKEFERNIKNS